MSEELLNTQEHVEPIEDAQLDWAEPKPVTASATVVNWSESLLSREEIGELKSRWNSIQVGFVDEPHASVEQADALAAETMEKINKMLSFQRATLNELWVGHDDISTEDLRIALQHYRSLFNRLLEF